MQPQRAQRAQSPTGVMKCLTVCQPYATLLVKRPDIKAAEYRSWKTNYRGPLLIHAGVNRTWYTTADKRECCAAPPRVVPYGALVGLVELDGMVWTGDLWAWRMSTPVPFFRPIPMKGKRGLWPVAFGVVRDELKRSIDSLPRNATPGFWLAWYHQMGKCNRRDTEAQRTQS